MTASSHLLSNLKGSAALGTQKAKLSRLFQVKLWWRVFGRHRLRENDVDPREREGNVVHCVTIGMCVGGRGGVLTDNFVLAVAYLVEQNKLLISFSFHSLFLK